jgi:glycosyltransferase involved in cell wall biosynthesis
VLSVVIPTRNRCDVLRRTLSGLSRQRMPAGAFEVVVVDNGSTDETIQAVQAEAVRAPVELHLEREPTRGPAAARNRGLARAAGDLVLFLGDDTEPAELDLLARHAELHKLRPEPTYAVLGRATWHPSRPITPFMRWLEESGPLFPYNLISDGPVPVSDFFCTAHVSAKRSTLERVGGFDARFPYAAVEDVELGVRLASVGVELDYRSELLVLHDHPTTVGRSVEKMARTGRSAALYNALHPDRPHWAMAEPDGIRWNALERARPLIETLAKAPLPGRAAAPVWRLLHLAAYAKGYRDGPTAV